MHQIIIFTSTLPFLSDRIPMNAAAITFCLDQLQQLIRKRIAEYFAGQLSSVGEPFDPQLDNSSDDPLTSFLSESNLSSDEKIILLLALIPHIYPHFFEPIIQEFLPQGGDFIEFGGVKTGNNRCMIPTGETALFILAGNDLSRRINLAQLFSNEHLFARNNILYLEQVKEGEPLMSGRLIMERDWIDRFLTGHVSKPNFSPEFPAKLITTKMNWEDLVLHPQTREQTEMIKIWLKHNKELMQDPVLSKKLKPGYRVLFYGPPGTGKTLTASLLGKQFNKDVYLVDLSQVVSKYIGETEKNLEKIFSRAEHKDWILFFDEADALFGKRTNVQSSHDRYANQEVSYLLQRVEDFSGLLILASNYKSNIDAAFLRRFHQITYFPMPNAQERKTLWEKTLPAKLLLETSSDLKVLCEKFELSGAAILNVIHYASLKALERNDELIRFRDLQEGIRREFQKEDKSMVGLTS